MINGRRYTPSKPPNIIIKTECKQNFETIKSALIKVLEPDRYTIHQLEATKFLQSSSWKDSCCLLLFNIDKTLNHQSKSTITTYLSECNGRILFYSSEGKNLELPALDLSTLFYCWWFLLVILLDISLDFYFCLFFLFREPFPNCHSSIYTRIFYFIFRLYSLSFVYFYPTHRTPWKTVDLNLYMFFIFYWM